MNTLPKTDAAAHSKFAALIPGACQQGRALLSSDNEAGQSLVEFAICLPVLLLVVTAIFQFGITLNNYLMLTDATNVGARQLAISRGQNTDPCAYTASAVYAAAPNLKQANFAFAFLLNGVAYVGNSCPSANSTSGAAGNLLQGKSAQLTITYPCSLAVYGANYAPGCSLKAQTAELVQ